MIRYTWQTGDTLALVAGRTLSQTTWPDTATFMAQIAAANGAIYDWPSVASGTTVLLPIGLAS